SLIVQNIGSDINDEQLADVFSEYAPVKHSTVVRDRESKKSKGYGFVAFGSVKDAENALRAIKTSPEYSSWTVKVARHRNRAAADQEVSESVAELAHKYASTDDGELQSTNTVVDPAARSARLIIRNLPWSISKPQQLQKMFAQFGVVHDVQIPKNGTRLRGFAFVRLGSHRAADLAKQHLSGTKIDGREITVDFAISKDRFLDQKKPEPVDAESSSDSEHDSKSNSDSESESESDSESNSDSDNEQREPLKSKKPSSTPSRRQSETFDRTVFVRNIPYTATKETLEELFSVFGPVRYALPVIDKQTNVPKGTAFVCFSKPEDAKECVMNCPKQDSANTLVIPEGTDQRYIFNGRLLSVVHAVDRTTAEQNASIKSKMEKVDKRNTFLLQEGRIGKGSALAEAMTPAELEIREQSYQLRKKQLASNPVLHVSLTKLAIRNIPRTMDAKALKQLARKAVVQFAIEARNGLRDPLTKEELLRSKEASKLVPKSKKHGVVRNVHIVNENKVADGGRSRGYGFVEYASHRWALMGARWLNGHQVTAEEINPEDPDSVSEVKNRRLVVEFAIDNVQITKRKLDQ
ncbi:hypothetical protein CANCADRAFT_14504, partial [Tortispora caseinolytica NRRL Y-17796]